MIFCPWFFGNTVFSSFSISISSSLSNLPACHSLQWRHNPPAPIRCCHWYSSTHMLCYAIKCHFSNFFLFFSKTERWNWIANNSNGSSSLFLSVERVFIKISNCIGSLFAKMYQSPHNPMLVYYKILRKYVKHLQGPLGKVSWESWGNGRIVYTTLMVHSHV